MHCIILVKQVPDVGNIPEDAWDREKGTLRRAMLDSVPNPLDLHAVSFAHEVTASDPDAKTIYLTMGPPQAREVLLDCMSRAPGEGVLLTDRLMGGADTVATAYSLALAIRRIETELLGGSRDYLIVTGMQSVDGDTAQVPPQVAEELGIDQVAYAESVRLEPELTFRRIGADGMEDIVPRRFPVLVTVTACTDVLYRSFHAARAARNIPIHTWSAADVGATEERVGLRGSRTQVSRIFSPSDDRARTCQMVSDPGELVRMVAARYRQPDDAQALSDEDDYARDGREPSRHGPFWVLAEREGNGFRPVSLELIGKVRELADILGEKVGVVLLGHELGNLPARLIHHGADVVYAVEHPLLAAFSPIPWKKAIAALVREHQPQAMIFGATPMGRELASRIAYACDCGLTADCTGLDIGDHEKTGGVAILRQTRPALGGNIMATILTKDSPTQMATVRPGVFRLPVADRARIGEVIRVRPDIAPTDLTVDATRVAAVVSEPTLRHARIIVAGGHGIRSRAAFEHYLQPLAEGLERMLGDEARVAGSRRAVEDGYTSHDYQVGQTGQTVAPRLYIAIGISGAVQHIAGMNRSDVVVAVNRDPHARIFKNADFGIVGDLETIVPGLISATRDSGEPDEPDELAELAG